MRNTSGRITRPKLRKFIPVIRRTSGRAIAMVSASSMPSVIHTGSSAITWRIDLPEAPLRNGMKLPRIAPRVILHIFLLTPQPVSLALIHCPRASRSR